MSSAREKSSSSSESPVGAGQPINMIMVEGAGGRHSEADRRRVRAAAARASAQASRETRQRNREDREQSHVAEAPFLSRQVQSETSQHVLGSDVSRSGFDPSPPQTIEQSVQAQSYPSDAQVPIQTTREFIHTPLMAWSELLRHGPDIVSVTELRTERQGSLVPGNLEDFMDEAFIANAAALDRMEIGRGLPIVLPGGFRDLRQEVLLEDRLVVLISRTACFDLVSPLVESRQRTLLFELIQSVASGSFAFFHPVQNYLRLACVCLVIFQGQSADSRAFANGWRNDDGLRLAWEEARYLDHMALQDRATARATLWAVSVICATSGCWLEGFTQPLLEILHELRLHSWMDVQEVLVHFIYPRSLLEERCRRVYEALHRSPNFTN